MSQPPALVRIPAIGYRRTPWKNGGGVTVDIAAVYLPGAEPGGWTGLVWRLGHTRIETPAPFSDLPGIDRVLTVTGGRGLVLRVADGRALDVREPFRSVRFPGEWEIRSEIEHGPVEVLNLMVARELVEGDVLWPAEGGSVQVPAGDVVLYAPAADAAVRIEGDRVEIPGGDAVRFKAGSGMRIERERGLVAVASIPGRPGAASP